MNILNDKIILTDCDGVLMDWSSAFYQWMENKGYEKTVAGVYKIDKAFGLDYEEGNRLVREFNESAWMGYLKAFRDARSGVAHLYEAGYRFHCITSLSLDKKAKRLRMYNLENVFGKGVFKELVCLDTGADKDQALEKYRDSGLYWIEDKPENAAVGADVGLKSLLITHDYNVDYKNEQVLRVANWAEIVDIIVNDKF